MLNPFRKAADAAMPNQSGCGVLRSFKGLLGFRHERVRMFAWIFLGMLLVGVVFAGKLSAQDPAVKESAKTEVKPPSSLDHWEEAAVFLFQEAHRGFAKSAALASREGDTQEARANRLGEGVTLLTIQPRTQGNIQRAQEIFEELIAGDAKDESGLAARMSLARLFEFHTSPQEHTKARELYSGLVDDGVGDPVAELAASRLVLIDLYAANSIEELNAAAQQLAPIGAKLQTTIGRREFYTNLGLTMHALKGDHQLAVEYLIAAEREGLPMQQIDAPVLLAIAALAEELGDMELAKEYYTTFVNRYQRDSRRYSVLEILENMGGSNPNAAEESSSPNSDEVPNRQPEN